MKAQSRNFLCFHSLGDSLSCALTSRVFLLFFRYALAALLSSSGDDDSPHAEAKPNSQFVKQRTNRRHELLRLEGIDR